MSEQSDKRDERCMHGVWKADHCYACEKMGDEIYGATLTKEKIEEWRKDLVEWNEDPSDEYVKEVNQLCDAAMRAVSSTAPVSAHIESPEDVDRRTMLAESNVPTKPLGYCLIDGDGKMFWDEDGCVSSVESELLGWLETLQGDNPDDGWRIVPFFAPSATAFTSAQTDDCPHGAGYGGSRKGPCALCEAARLEQFDIQGSHG